MKEERTRILNMVEEGKISVDDADELISSLHGSDGAAVSDDGTFLEGANLEPLLEALADTSIDVDTDDAHVRIYCE